MREIEFRCFDKVKNVMLEVDSISNFYVIVSPDYNDEEGNYSYELQWKSFGDGSENVNCELMQYTGLKDKNGEKIFEGDIVKGWVHDEHIPFVVEYKAGIYSCGFIGNAIDKLSSINVWYSGLEVIGNIHDNPEFLR